MEDKVVIEINLEVLEQFIHFYNKAKEHAHNIF